MGIRTSPTLRRRRLAMELRRLRDEAGIRAADVAAELGCSPGKVSQMETGRVAISVPDTKAMLEMYGITGEHRAALVELARTAKQKGWWVPHSAAVLPWFQRYIGLETESSTLRNYESEFIPGLLQVEGYQRALLASDLTPWTDQQVDRMVALRKSRQQILAGPGAPRFWFIINEAALCRRVGEPETMAAQLQRLLEVGRMTNVVLQVLPFTSGAHVAMTGAFMLVEFPEAGDPDVVYLEHLTGASYIEDDDEVTHYKLAFNDLMASALSRTRSASLIREVIKEL
jgi:transcriptional regulator with XRE-family HTH domain